MGDRVNFCHLHPLYSTSICSTGEPTGTGPGFREGLWRGLLVVRSPRTKQIKDEPTGTGRAAVDRTRSPRRPLQRPYRKPWYEGT
jgi:hypothetical protein